MSDAGGGEREPVRPSDYRVARIGAAAALVAVLAFLLVFDAVSADYDISAVVLVTLVTTILTLLGIEAAQHLPFGRRER